MPNDTPDPHDTEDIHVHVHEADETPKAPLVEERESVPNAGVPAPKRVSSRPIITTIANLAAVTAVGAAIALTAVDRNNGPKTPRPPFVEKKKETKVGGPNGQGGSAGGPPDTGLMDDAGAPDDGGVCVADAGTDASDMDASAEVAYDAGDGAPDAGYEAGTDGGTTPVTDEDLCGRGSFAQDALPDEMAKPGEKECQFVTDPDGTMRIIGHTLIDADGKPRDCFVQPVFSPNAAIKVRGEVSGSATQQGRIFLTKGKLCVMMLGDKNAPVNTDTQALVIGEASLHIETNQRVIIKILEPEMDPKTDRMMHYALVTPVEGEVLINQDNRKEQYVLKKGDTPLKIPLDILHNESMGCYVASAQGNEAERQTGGAFLLGAGAIFLLLRRQKKKTAK